MACEVIVGSNGKALAIACSRNRVAACSVPECRRPHTKLCDFPIAGKASLGVPAGTCDAKLCDAHATSQAEGVDFCPAHHARSKLGKAAASTREVAP